MIVSENFTRNSISIFPQVSRHHQEIRLTEREKEFLILCVSELTYKEIADRMHIATRSVDNYRESLFEKLNLKSRVGLVLYALKHKMTEIS